MRTRFLVAATMLILLASPIVQGADQGSEVSLMLTANELRDSDGDSRNDTVRIVATVESSTTKIVHVSLLSESSSDELIMTRIVQSTSEPSIVAFNVTAWADGAYSFTLIASRPGGEEFQRIDLGDRSLSQGFIGPEATMRLVGEQTIWKGETCSIEMSILDDIAERYDLLTSVRLTGHPFPVDLHHGKHDVDCSNWPQGTYTLSLTVTNSLGAEASTSLEVSILQPLPPSGVVTVSGNNTDSGESCLVQFEMDEGPIVSGTTVIFSTPYGTIRDALFVDCTDWDPGAHLVKIQLTDINGRTSLIPAHVIRHVPGLVIKEDTGWVNRSQAAAFAPEAADPAIWAPLVVGGGVLFILALVITLRVRAPGRSDSDLQFDDLTPPGDPYAEVEKDDHGQWWQRHSDGRIEWWDAIANAWEPWDTL